MEYTTEIFSRFLRALGVFDKEVKAVFKATEKLFSDRESEEKSEWENVQNELEQSINSQISKCVDISSNYRRYMDDVYMKDVSDKKEIFARLQKCKEMLSLISSAENSITSKHKYNSETISQNHSLSITLSDLIDGKVDFIELAYAVNAAINNGKKKDIFTASSQFYYICQYAEKALKEEISLLQMKIVENKDSIHVEYNNVGISAHQKLEYEWDVAMTKLEDMSATSVKQKKRIKKETQNTQSSGVTGKRKHLKRIVDGFCSKFPPNEFAAEYIRIYSLEPSYSRYECVSEIPRDIYISTLEYDISSWNLCDFTKEFLDKYYYFMFSGNKLCIPYCVKFGAEFNYLFQFDEDDKQRAVSDACDMGMRLFMMLPPGKVNFTFVDPVSLGESFATFTRLVNVDDRTSEVINGKIWSAPNDIENKLRIMTDHISNVTQRCLQGKYDNIFEYNKAAEQNAEAYQIIMLMDFPAGLTDQSLHLLEQISASGPQCGVFTIIYRNESQYSKIPERSYPLIDNIENGFQIFNYSDDGKKIICTDTFNGQPFLWQGISMPSTEKMDCIIATLKKGIKSADKVVIGIEKVSKKEEERDESETTTKDGLRIPIGLHGANEVQYLTLGVGGSHHALIAGVAGSGKSSLLHTIILQALSQYGPDELHIYLVDFKRGVEFKIYADFVLPSFKVIAIESEREFGYNILIALEREQKIRADLFKKSHVDKIEEYRDLGKKMPRVLVIMDEFHELFSNANDEFSKKSATIMERIVRQGRAFGVHLILASQSYSNITGIDRAVFDQMAVRIVLKCSKFDANLLLDNGSTEIDQISINDPGRAVYNSEAGNKEYNSHFRVAYIDPDKHRSILQEISDKTLFYVNKPTRILLSNIEDNKYSIFNQFETYEPSHCPVLGRLYIGEPLSVTNNMNIDLSRNDNSNLLMLGNDTEKARSMFTFAILSICINYRVKHGKVPEQPFIYLLNCKPLDDSYFKDTTKIIANELLTEYVRYIHCGDENSAHEVISELLDNIKGITSVGNTDKYFFVFGYQRAEELKSETKLSQGDDIDNLFNLMPSSSNKPQLSPKEIFHLIVKDGAKRGVHVILWQDSYNALQQDDNNIMSYFNLKVAFDMSPEEFSRSVGENDISLMSTNNAIYYNKARDNQKFRPYQAPDEEWLKDISAKLH